jgi:anti-sigma factor RsiW
MTQHWMDRLSEYVDGELSAAEAEAVEAHLLECADCGNTLQELRAVVARARQVIDRPPADDLWPGIAARLTQSAPEQTKRKVAFSIPQLAAASVALMLMSAGTVYLMVNRAPRSGTASGSVPATALAPVTTREALRQPVMAVKSPGSENYNVAITELERALTSGRTTLDTATVRILETNLRTIDAAITEARTALGRDPGNQYLNRYLDETMQKKIQLLRRATGILRAET